uniref:SCAN box domain-containing protein n=1 Tax=Sparus aurata TaxID=8175 RepID=A0A671XNE1_SPAAU
MVNFHIKQQMRVSLKSGQVTFDVGANLRLMPRLNERDPDTFFTLFERIADAKNWPDADKTLMLQCVLTGRAQDAYSALSASDCRSYAKVKSAVLKAFELVPEAYSQRFRNWGKSDRQTNVEFARDLLSHFNRWCSAASVESFEGLCELMVLEQFKNSIPQRIATYVSEQKVTTVHRAAELADDFVLTHNSGFGEVRVASELRRTSNNYGSSRYGGQSSIVGPAHTFKASRVRDDGGRSGLCHYCHGAGHWKDQCPVLRSGNKRKSYPTAPAPALSCSSAQGPVPECGDFEPFIVNAVVSLVGSEERVPIKFLRDTGAKHSFILGSVLPFSPATETREFILMRGMEMGLVPVLLHSMMLDCDLVQGVVAVGVRPALPVDGVALILGNDLAGSAVWASLPPSPVVTPKLLVTVGPDECGRKYPHVFPSCAVTRAQLLGLLQTWLLVESKR